MKGIATELSYVFDGTDWKKEFKVNDFSGSLRLAYHEDKHIVSEYFYYPYGKKININENNPNNSLNQRQKYIGKEKDKETELADHGVRKYDSEIGRFTSIDPLWEKYYS